jgi:integrase
MTAFIFKPKRRRGGKLRVSSTWWLRFAHDGEKLQSICLGVTDKQVAQQKRNEFVQEREREAAGIIAPKPLREGAAKLLSEHLSEFVSFLRSRGRDDMYVYNIEKRIKRLLDDCSWKLARDITAESFVAWRLNATDPKTGKLLAAKTQNDYADAMIAMLNWMQRRGRLLAVPLKREELKVKTAGQEKRAKRAFTDAEIVKLRSVAGRHATLYLAAVLTGLRRSELKQLRWGDVHLDALRPFLSVRASTTKNAKPACILLRDDLAAELRALRPGDGADRRRVFQPMPKNATFKAHLKAAGIAERDGQDRMACFHSFRKTFNTCLQRAGVAESVVMQMMRVTDRRLIDKTYLDAALLPVADAMEKMPRFEAVQVAVQAAAATGTDDVCANLCATPSGKGRERGFPLGSNPSTPAFPASGHSPFDQHKSVCRPVSRVFLVSPRQCCSDS